ncbi:MAG: YlbF family regulator [Tissierellia bacterium]|nr:YlbF family regulator [Tissierellia bacterium]
MSYVYDQAHNLARAIKESEEYRTYMEKRKIVYGDEKNKNMVEDFRQRIMKMQMDQMAGKEVDPEEIERTNNLENVLMLNTSINEFFTAELRFSQLVQDINDIIGKAIEIEQD